MGLERIVSKRKGPTYRSGRSPELAQVKPIFYTSIC
jgi:ATP-dependent DNA ligase